MDASYVEKSTSLFLNKDNNEDKNKNKDNDDDDDDDTNNNNHILLKECRCPTAKQQIC